MGYFTDRVGLLCSNLLQTSKFILAYGWTHFCVNSERFMAYIGIPNSPEGIIYMNGSVYSIILTYNAKTNSPEGIPFIPLVNYLRALFIIPMDLVV